MTEVSGEMCAEERDTIEHYSNRIYFDSNFKFLNTHKGLRPGEIHTFLGTAGGGKSTLMRTILIDMLENTDVKILLLLSEEDRVEFLVQFNKSGYKHKLERLHIISELDLMEKHKSNRLMWDAIRFHMKEFKPSIFMYDNITTSKMYMDLTVKQQGEFCIGLKTMCKRVNIPFLIVAHANAQVSDSVNRLIEMNDIRGSKSIVNLSHFFYIMQRFHTPEGIFPTLRITKHRSQEAKCKLFSFKYVDKRRIYCQDIEVDFKRFKEVFKSRNVL